MRYSWLTLCLLATPGLGQEGRGPPKPTGPAASQASAVETAGGPVSPFQDLQTHLLKLRGEREALQHDQIQAAQQAQNSWLSETEDNSRLRLQLGGLLTRLGTYKPQAPAPQPVPPVVQRPAVSPPAAKQARQQSVSPPPGPAPVVGLDLSIPARQTVETPASPDSPPVLEPLLLAHALFRSGNYEGALPAYRLIRLEGLKAEERAPVQYMVAACLRKLGKTDEASTLFREVANCRGDEQVAACAQWQLSVLRWQREMEQQLQSIRERRKTLGETP
jgi:TolA-binding protein